MFFRILINVILVRKHPLHCILITLVTIHVPLAIINIQHQPQEHVENAIVTNVLHAQIMELLHV